jgi:hypothetical protein
LKTRRFTASNKVDEALSISTHWRGEMAVMRVLSVMMKFVAMDGWGALGDGTPCNLGCGVVISHDTSRSAPARPLIPA